MLTPLLSDPEWNDRKLALITRHHLERTERFKLEEVAWRDLEQVHSDQRATLTAQPVNAQAWADLLTWQTSAIKNWRSETVATRQSMQLRQNQEMEDLEAERHKP